METKESVELDYSDLIGRPFREFGRGPEAYDCFGLWIEINKRLGIKVLDYGQLIGENSETICKKADEYRPKFTKIKEPQPGDLILFRTDTGLTDHIGVIVQPGLFLHVLKKQGILCTYLDNYFWRGRIEGLYRYAG